MTAGTIHLVTGATGFVGGAIVLELLTRTEAPVLCLTRPKGAMTPADRLRAALMRAARAYGRVDLRGEIIDRCHAISGDVAEPRCGISETVTVPIAQVWHAAGSLLYEDRQAAEIARHNIVGTANVIGLARELSVACFNHVSTAYVSGRRAGRISATPVTDQTLVNNHYERSKIVAENTVLTSGIDRIRVFRPSIVIGHSRTFAATNFTGLYGFIDGLAQVRSAIRPTFGDYLKFRPLRLLGAADTRINFVPIDHVAKAAVSLGLQDESHGIYHLANSSQPVLGDSIAVLADRLGILPPQFVPDSSELSLIDERMDRRLAFYRPYLKESRYFDPSGLEQISGESVLDFPLPPERLRNYIDWYLTYQRKRRGNAN